MAFLLKNEEALELILNQLREWTDDEDVLKLYEKFYDNMLDQGVFDSGEPMGIYYVARTDWNRTSVVSEDDEDFEAMKNQFKAEGPGIYFVGNDHHGTIEVADNDEEPTMFLFGEY